MCVCIFAVCALSLKLYLPHDLPRMADTGGWYFVANSPLKQMPQCVLHRPGQSRVHFSAAIIFVLLCWYCCKFKSSCKLGESLDGVSLIEAAGSCCYLLSCIVLKSFQIMILFKCILCAFACAHAMCTCLPMCFYAFLCMCVPA